MHDSWKPIPPGLEFAGCSECNILKIIEAYWNPSSLGASDFTDARYVRRYVCLGTSTI